jgi:hypothetical protein
MAGGSRAYVVRNADPGEVPDEVPRIYPYTLHGLQDALSEALYRSYAGRAQVVTVASGEETTVIRRYEDGHEVPIKPLDPLGIG